MSPNQIQKFPCMLLKFLIHENHFHFLKSGPLYNGWKFLILIMGLSGTVIHCVDF